MDDSIDRQIGEGVGRVNDGAARLPALTPRGLEANNSHHDGRRHSY